MRMALRPGGNRMWKSLAAGLAALVVSACGGGDYGSSGTQGADPRIEIGNATQLSSVMRPVPADAESGLSTIGNEPPVTSGNDAISLTVHYKRAAGDYTGWQLHTWGSATSPNWNEGINVTSSDAFGNVYAVPLAKKTGDVGYLLHKGDTKDHDGKDQSYTLKPGVNEIWRVQGDATTYTCAALTTCGATAAPAVDINTVRVHYQRYGTDYDAWGLHLWGSNGIDMARAPGIVIEDWNNAVPLSKMPGYSAAKGSERVFDIPVINPKTDATKTGLEFIIHGIGADKSGDKDGRSDNIKVDYSKLTIKDKVGEIWLVQENSTIYTSAVDLRSSSLSTAQAVWLNKQLIKWPKIAGSGTVKLYYSANGQLKARKDEKVANADGFLTLEVFTGTVPTAAAARFKWVSAGTIFAVKTADLAQLPALHQKQLAIVQEDSAGMVQNASGIQVAGALDDLYSAAATVTDLGATVTGGTTTFKLWAPTAQTVTVYFYDTATGPATGMALMTFNGTTGIYSGSTNSDLTGKYYRYGVELFVRGVGVVRNLVTDPYSLGLSTDSKRSQVLNLAAANLKPAGWDTMVLPTKVKAATDMSIYELHVRDFSANDSTVSAANRGKYLAFTEASANGMKHLKALSDAGLTDVHLLPTFDIASVPEASCVTPAIPAGLSFDGLDQSTLLRSTQDLDCFNWGYDPQHYTVPEGSYASDPSDSTKRILEFRSMVKAMNDAGLRVGMDVVYNHTVASGQKDKSVLDRVVPGYYHRLSKNGAVTADSCCDDTATENLMMGKLMTDSAITWARDYKISSLRFDLMGIQPRAVMQDLKAKVKTAVGREVQMFGEGWNIDGATKDNARFETATKGNLAGDSIGTFGDWLRDAVRGTKGFMKSRDQGYVNGASYDSNGVSTIDEGTMKWMSDLVKGGLAGSLKDYVLAFNWGQTIPLSEHDSGLGFATQPDEVVNYVENHDNQTLFDNNAMKLPTNTSKADRARVQILGASTVAFAQGIAYYHAGVDTLRSKSLDRNSYNSGDWFNRIDWSYSDNYFGTGLPFEGNADTTATMKTILGSTAAIKPGAADIAWTRDAFRDLLKLRYSSSLFRMTSAADIKSRLKFFNAGGDMTVPTVIVGHLNGVAPTAYPGANFKEVVYLINVDKTAKSVTVDALKGKGFALHPVQASGSDSVVKGATFSNTDGKFTVPARTAAVFVVN